MLSAEQIHLLEKPFTFEEHAMDPNIYIRKSAIRRRLAEVDAAWEMTPPQLMNANENVVLMSGGLTVAGVTRYAVGTGIITRTKINKQSGDVIALPDYEVARNLAHAYKTAASDLLPRCALLFGVGDYLRDIPKNVKGNDRAFAEWLRSISTPQHWARTTAGQHFQTLMRDLNLTWEAVRQNLEPNHMLNRLSDTHLNEAQAIARLHQIADELHS